MVNESNSRIGKLLRAKITNYRAWEHRSMIAIRRIKVLLIHL